MKRLPAILAGFILVGCASPSKQAQKALAKEAALRADSAKVDDELAGKGKALVYGTGLALSLAPASPATTLAADLNRQAGTVFGPPSFEDSATFTRIVAGTLSQEPEKAVAASREAEKFGATIEALQTKSGSLQTKLEKSEVAKDALLLRESALAQTWVSLKHWVWWIVGIVVGLWLLPKLLRLATLLIPGLGPLAGPAASLVARMVSHAVDNVPGVATKAGVVVKEVYEATEAAAERSVNALENLKQVPELREAVKKELKAAPEASVAVEQEIARLRSGGSSPS